MFLVSVRPPPRGITATWIPAASAWILYLSVVQTTVCLAWVIHSSLPRAPLVQLQPNNLQTTINVTHNPTFELDKGRLYVTLGKYITISAFDLVAETAENTTAHPVVSRPSLRPSVTSGCPRCGSGWTTSRTPLPPFTDAA